MSADGGARQPVGVFDSGVGGLSVVSELRRALPREDIVYFADTANCPYGARPAAEIQALSEQATAFLLKQGAKIIVVACNTASAAGLRPLRALHGPGLPIVGLVPPVKPAVALSRSGVIGVLATPGTLQGALLREVIAEFATPLGVPLEHHYLVGRQLHPMHIEQEGILMPNPYVVSLDQQELRVKEYRRVGSDGSDPADEPPP